MWGRDEEVGAVGAVAGLTPLLYYIILYHIISVCLSGLAGIWPGSQVSRSRSLGEKPINIIVISVFQPASLQIGELIVSKTQPSIHKKIVYRVSNIMVSTYQYRSIN